MSKNQLQNFLTIENGCFISQVFSQRPNGEASNILDTENKKPWVVESDLPQHCVINLTKMKSRPPLFNKIGFYFWHDFDSTPSLIQISYKNDKSEDWIIVGKLRLSRIAEEWQYFKIKQISAVSITFLKIKLVENFGDEKNTFLNKVFLGFSKDGVADATNPSAPRNKIISEHLKLTSTQRQLKKVQEQMKIMKQSEHQLRQTVKQQKDVIFKMQDTIKKLAKNLERLHQIQQLQSKKISLLQGQKNHPKLKSQPKQFFSGHIQQNHRPSKIEALNHQLIEELIKKKRTSGKKSNNTSYSKVNKKSYSKENQSTKDLLKYKQTIAKQIYENNEDPYLSQYSCQEPLQQGNVENLMSELQRLMTLRQIKKSQLSRNSRKRQIDDSYDEHQ